MIYSIDDIKKLLSCYFFSDNNLNSLEEAATNQQQDFIASLISFIEENLQTLEPHLPKLIDLINMLFPEMKKLDDLTNIMHFIDFTLKNEKELVCNPSFVVKCFTTDINLCNSLKNLYIFRIIEKIRFAKMQKDNLSDPAAYKRHTTKALTAIKDALRVLFELNTDYDELKAILEKYYEFNRQVNTTNCWTEFFSLKGYGTFDQFIKEKNIDERVHFDTEFD